MLRNPDGKLLVAATAIYVVAFTLSRHASAHTLGPFSQGNFSEIQVGPATDNIQGFDPGDEDTIVTTFTNNSANDATFTLRPAQGLPGATCGGVMVAKGKTGDCKYTTLNAAAAAVGSVIVSGGVTFAADYHAYPPVSPIAFVPAPGAPPFVIGGTLDDELASFVLTSTLSNAGDGLFQYSYGVTTTSTSPVSFDWLSAGLTGSVSAATPFNLTFSSDEPALEVDNIADFSLSGSDRVPGAPAFVPAVPEPGSGAVLGTFVSILLGVLGVSRPSRRRGA